MGAGHGVCRRRSGVARGLAETGRGSQHRPPLKRIAPDGVADRKTSFLNDVVVDEKRRVAYISDSGSRSARKTAWGLIVVDFTTGTARRVLDRHPALPGLSRASRWFHTVRRSGRVNPY